MEKLVLQDNEGRVLRAFAWSGEPVQVIRRGDTRRLELVQSTDDLQKRKIPFESLGELSRDGLNQKPHLVGELGHLSLIENVGEVVRDEKDHEENRRVLYFTLAILFLLVLSLGSALRNVAEMTPKLEEELQQQVVRIVKSMVKPEQPKAIIANSATEPTQKAPTKTAAIKRMGALSALGSLNKSKQRGGLNLGAAQTTAGPGLGGTQGSGGTQTSLYAKGIVSAPLGAGANVQGAGGYGTKGKGGGQAGYGKLALTGSTGVSAIPLGAEASVAQGLDRDQIAAVINRNQGQIRFCYEQGLQSDAALNGRVAVDFTIGGNGMVKEAGVANSTLKAKTVEDCIVMRLKSWKFPLPDGGVDVKVSYPFTLRRSGQG
ncbi:MAG: AgmX/PglI C-terminal domain-containing protein [Bdellovibrio sp.]